MRSNVLQQLASDIAERLVIDINDAPSLKPTRVPDIGSMLISEIAQEVVAVLFGNVMISDQTESQLDRQLRRLSQRRKFIADEYEQLYEEEEEEDEDDNEGEDEEEDDDRPETGNAEPKYKNIEALLKYIETDSDKNGVKLVIMNFND